MNANTFPSFDMDFTKMFAEFKAPVIDMEKLMASQRANFEAVVEANKLAFEGVQAVMRRNTEIMQATVKEMTDAMNQLVSEGTPEDRVVRQTELLKTALESTLSNAKELMDMLMKSNTDAGDVVVKRAMATLDEVKEMMKEVTAK